MDGVQQTEGKNGRVSAKAHRVYGLRILLYVVGPCAGTMPRFCKALTGVNLRLCPHWVDAASWSRYCTGTGRPCAAAGDGGWP